MNFNDEQTNSSLKLSSKRLKSGKVQVRFEIRGDSQMGEYGYLLAEPKTSLREVVVRIFDELGRGGRAASQRHLFNVGEKAQSTEMIIIR